MKKAPLARVLYRQWGFDFPSNWRSLYWIAVTSVCNLHAKASRGSSYEALETECYGFPGCMVLSASYLRAIWCHGLEIIMLPSNILATNLLPSDACRGVPFSAMQTKLVTDARSGQGLLTFTGKHALLARYQPLSLRCRCRLSFGRICDVTWKQICWCYPA